MAKAPATKKKAAAKKTATKKVAVKRAATKKSGRPAKAATKVAQAAVAQAPQKNAFEEKFGEGTAFDLDYGKLLIIALCIYIAVQVRELQAGFYIATNSPEMAWLNLQLKSASSLTLHATTLLKLRFLAGGKAGWKLTKAKLEEPVGMTTTCSQLRG